MFKRIKQLSTWLLSVAAMLNLAFFAFVGALVLFNNLPFAIACFFASSLIEGQVYKLNIFDYFKKVTDKFYVARNSLIEPLLNELSQDVDHKENFSFLSDYQQQLEYLAQLEKQDKTKRKLTKRRIHEMENAFIEYILYNKHQNLFKSQSGKLRDILDTHHNALIKKTKLKQTLVKLAIPLTLLAAISWGLAGIPMMSTGLAIIGLSAPILVPTIIALTTILSCVAFYFVMQNNIIDIIVDESIQTFFKNFKTSLEPKPEEGFFRYILRYNFNLLKYGSIMALGAFVTVCTFGTWWKAVKAGSKVVPVLKKIPNLVRAVTVPAMAVVTELFAFENALESIKVLSEIRIIKPVKQFAHKVKKHWQEENIIQFINPFRLLSPVIEKAGRIGLLAFHLISMAVTVDQTKGIPPAAPATAGAVSEGLTDLHYFAPQKKYVWDLPGILLAPIVLPLSFLASSWDYLSGFLSKTNQNHNKPNFKKSLDKYFPIKLNKQDENNHQTNSPALPKPSLAWQKHELKQAIKTKASHNKQKQKAIYHLIDSNLHGESGNHHQQVELFLSTHRHALQKGKTKSVKFIDRFNAECEEGYFDLDEGRINQRPLSAQC